MTLKNAARRQLVSFLVWLVVVVSVSACHKSPVGPSDTATPSAAVQAGNAPRSFKVATWNIRSGMGIRGFTTTGWDSGTLNCTDRSKPLNAWGMGIPQRELERVRDDAGVVAMAVQEAWNCGNPGNINSVLGFRDVSREMNGIALLARYGFAAPPTYQKINASQYLVGGPVCLDAACSATVPMFSTHWDGGGTDDFTEQAQHVVDALAAQTGPHLFMGDLNTFKIDAWNPKVPCTADDTPGRTRAIAIIENGGYIDTWKATQSGEGWTGMASRAGCGSPPGDLFKRIDYVFAKGLTPTSIVRVGRAAPGADSPSDHVGLIGELAIRR